jgi:hypothetical protein
LKPKPTGQWITIEAERVLYVDRGQSVIVCDRAQRGPVTLLLRLSDVEMQKLREANHGGV